MQIRDLKLERVSLNMLYTRPEPMNLHDLCLIQISFNPFNA